MAAAGTTIIEGEILGVEPKQVTRRADSRQFTFFEVRMDDSTVYSTMNVEIANEAATYAATGKKVRLGVKIEDDGRFIKRYLNQVIGEVFANAPAPTNGNAAAVPVPTGFIPPKAQPSSVISNTDGLKETGVPNVLEVMDPAERAKQIEEERQLRIMRQAACKVASMLQAPGESQLDFFTNVDVLLRFFQTGIKPLSVEIAMDERK